MEQVLSYVVKKQYRFLNVFHSVSSLEVNL